MYVTHIISVTLQIVNSVMKCACYVPHNIKFSFSILFDKCCKLTSFLGRKIIVLSTLSGSTEKLRSVFVLTLPKKVKTKTQKCRQNFLVDAAAEQREKSSKIQPMVLRNCVVNCKHRL